MPKLPPELQKEIDETLAESAESDKEWEEEGKQIDAILYNEKKKQKLAASEKQAPPSMRAVWEGLGLKFANNGAPIPNAHNAVKVLEGFSEFRDGIWFDGFQRRIFTTWKSKKREWIDSDDLQLLRFMQNNVGLGRMAKQTVQDAVTIHAWNNTTNEFIEWLNTLTWDGVTRCETFFPILMGTEDNDYCRAVSKNFWVGMVSRGCQPGCQLDTMVILEGEQGTFKSTALRTIGGKWFSEVHKSVKDVDFPLIFHGKLLLEFGEFNSFRKAEINAIKGIITNRIDRLRSPYGKRFEDHPRTCTFVATTNDDSYLGDPTGARRFLPLRTGRIDLVGISGDREQLFAEAYALFKQNEPFWNYPESSKDEQEQRRVKDEWEFILEEYFKTAMQSDFRMTEIASEVLKIEARHFDLMCQKRIANCLRVLGYKKTKSHGTMVWRKIGPHSPQKVPF